MGENKRKVKNMALSRILVAQIVWRRPMKGQAATVVATTQVKRHNAKGKESGVKAARDKFHMNEAGSQSTGTLSLRGCGAVPLNELHSATRARWTANTLVRSDFDTGGAPPRLELMFKNASDGPMRSKLQEHIPHWAPWLSVVTSPSGTYAEVELLEYLELLYPLPLEPGRRWRIMLLDAFKPHMTERVRRVAWARRVIICLHGGGTTSVGQVNDTDLHHPLRTEYTELETEDALRQAMMGIACPITKKEDCMAWMCLVWCQAKLHKQATAGFKRVGVTNALDGSEDQEISREARTFWDDGNMKAERASAVADVDDEVDAGRLKWTYGDVYRLICEHPKRGHVDVQADDEGDEDDDDDGNAGWIDEGDEDDDEPPPEGPPPSLPASAAAPAAAETRAPPQQVLREVELAQDRLETLRIVLVQLQQAGVDHVANSVKSAIHQESKRMRSNSLVPDELRAAFADAEEEASREAKLRQALVSRDLAADAKARKTLKDLRQETRALQQKKEDLAKASSVEESMRALKRWDVSDFGQGNEKGGTKAHAANRREVLERLRRRAPALPPDLANDWDYFMRTWDTRRVMVSSTPWQKAAWGSRFRDMMVELLDEMKRDPRGDAFARWMRREMSMSHFPRADLHV